MQRLFARLRSGKALSALIYEGLLGPEEPELLLHRGKLIPLDCSGREVEPHNLQAREAIDELLLAHRIGRGGSGSGSGRLHVGSEMRAQGKSSLRAFAQSYTKVAEGAKPMEVTFLSWRIIDHCSSFEASAFVQQREAVSQTTLTASVAH